LDWESFHDKILCFHSKSKLSGCVMITITMKIRINKASMMSIACIFLRILNLWNLYEPCIYCTGTLLNFFHKKWVFTVQCCMCRRSLTTKQFIKWRIFTVHNNNNWLVCTFWMQFTYQSFLFDVCQLENNGNLMQMYRIICM